MSPFPKKTLNLVIILAINSIFFTALHSEKLENFAKFDSHKSKPLNLLRVSSRNYEPFMYRDENEQFNGIEYKLLEVIARKEHLKLSFQSQPSALNDHHLKWRFGAFFNQIRRKMQINLNFVAHQT